jgi:hypothetical protein
MQRACQQATQVALCPRTIACWGCCRLRPSSRELCRRHRRRGRVAAIGAALARRLGLWIASSPCGRAVAVAHDEGRIALRDGARRWVGGWAQCWSERLGRRWCLRARFHAAAGQRLVRGSDMHASQSSAPLRSGCENESLQMQMTTIDMAKPASRLRAALGSNGRSLSRGR